MPDETRHTLLSVSLLKADSPGDVRVLLSCSCGTSTDFTYPAGAAGEEGRSCPCDGCGTEHWFTPEQAKRAEWRRSLRSGTGDGDG